MRERCPETTEIDHRTIQCDAYTDEHTDEQPGHWGWAPYDRGKGFVMHSWGSNEPRTPND